MARPQQPELARSGKTDLDPDHVGTELEAKKPPRDKGPTGPVPPENQPGHQPDQPQDKPDPDAFAARLQGEERSENPGSPGNRDTRQLAVNVALFPVRMAQQGVQWGGQVLQRGVGLTVGGLQSLQRQVRKRT